MNVSRSDNFNRSELIGVRALCIVGILMSHSFAPYLFSDGQVWRVPTLFFLAGFSLTRERRIIPTIKYIAINFYSYVVAFSLIYLAFLTYVLMPYNDNFLHGSSIYGAFFNDILKFNLHANSIMLACWFLIPMAIALIVSIAITQYIHFNNASLSVLGFACVVAFFAIAQPEAPNWKLRLAAHSLLGTGYLLLGGAVFRSSKAMRLMKSGWFITLSLTLALTIGTAFGPFSVTWSWVTTQGNYWMALPASLLYIPALFWIGGRIADNAVVHFIGSNTKHIMAHHLFGFFLLNALLASTGFIAMSEIKPFTVVNHNFTWPLYLIFGFMWSFAIVKLINFFKEFISNYREQCTISFSNN